jgi:hypothetical protein
MLRPSAFIVALSATSLLAQDPGSEGQVSLPGINKLTIGGQYRLRYEAFRDYDLNSDAGANRDYFTQRARVDFKFDLAEKLSAFVQFQDAREWGEETALTDDSANGFDLHQGYVHMDDTPIIGGNTTIGRLEVNFGDQRLVGALDWATGARALDGIVQGWSMDKATLLAFVFQAGEALTAPEVNDDVHFGGLYYMREFGEGVHGDFYLMHLHDDGALPGGTANVSTIGTLWKFQANEQLDFGVEVALQFGEVGGADVSAGDAYAGHLDANWNFGGDRHMKGTFGLDVASGDDPATPDIERFNNLFPTSHMHWGMMDLALWENLMSPWLRFQFDTCAMSNLSITLLYLAAMEEADAFGGTRGMLTAGGGNDDHMGNELDFLWTRKLDWGGKLDSSLQLGLGIFMPGDGAENGVGAGNDDLAEFFYAQLNFKF